MSNTGLSNTVHGHGGTDFTVLANVEDDIHVIVSTQYQGDIWGGSLSVENSQHLRLLLEEAEIQAAPKPSKADRIREQANPRLYHAATGRDAFEYKGARLDTILEILDEEGDL